MTSSPTSERRFRVVVTRDATRVAPLATRLAGQGGDVVAVAITRTEVAPPDAWADLVARVARIDDYDAVVVASANAADALARALGEARVRIARAIAVGAATADALGRHGIAADVAARPDAIGVADEVLGRGARRVLWPRAEGGREEGIERLRAGGVSVDAPVAYRTVTADPGNARAALEGADVVCVYAPSQVAALAELGLLDLLGGAAVVAIGETTAAALRARGIAVAAVPASPDPDAMASAIIAVYPRRS